MIKLADKAKGKWPAVLQAMGVDRKYLTSKHGPCPICQAGKDRFRFDDKDGRGTWYCSQCGAGAGVDLVMKLCGLEFKAAAQEIEKHLGTARVTPIRQGRPVEMVKAEMRDIWRRSVPLMECDATAAWWLARTGYPPPSCPDLRAVKALAAPYGAGVFPAMVAKIRSLAGDTINIHRTFLTEYGQKAPMEDPRRVMDLQLPDGSAIRLRPPQDGVLGIAEGIETAEAAYLLHKIPCWATINAVILQKWEPPPELGIRRIVIFGDNDFNATGQAASWALARRMRMRKEPVAASVQWPPIEGTDWNDVLDAKREGPSRADMPIRQSVAAE